ncbi:MAG: hypothetical protein ACO3E1_04795 [Flavobacteriales bacterium]
MKSLFFYILFLGTLSVSATDLVELRNLLFVAPNSEATTKLIIEKTKDANEKSAVLLGFKATATMLMAKHVVMPTSKFAYFNEGRALLEKAIKAMPYIIELRFLRFCVQCNTPSFLGYNDAMLGDKIMLIGYLQSEVSKSDLDLKARIKNYLLKSKKVNAVEKSNIKDL